MKSSIWGIMVLKIPYCKIVRIKNMWATIGHYCHILRENSQLDRDQIFKGRGHNELKLIDELCPTLCDPMDCSLPGASVHEILQAGKLEWVAMPFSRESSWPKDQTLASYIAGRFFTIWATRGAPPPQDFLIGCILIGLENWKCEETLRYSLEVGVLSNLGSITSQRILGMGY